MTDRNVPDLMAALEASLASARANLPRCEWDGCDRPQAGLMRFCEHHAHRILMGHDEPPETGREKPQRCVMADKRIAFEITVLADRDTDPILLAERVFDFLASDPDDLFPEINEVEQYDGKLTDDQPGDRGEAE
jgi:hypothetical protein